MMRGVAVNRTFTAAISAPTVPKEAIAVPECAEGALPSVYQLRIVLRGVSPLIWRRLLIPVEDSVRPIGSTRHCRVGSEARRPGATRQPPRSRAHHRALGGPS
jgi:hypothetical protein